MRTIGASKASLGPRRGGRLSYGGSLRQQASTAKYSKAPSPGCWAPRNPIRVSEYYAPGACDSYPHINMNWTRLDRIAATCVFGYAFVLYVLTVAPTASFWDAGEFIAIAHGLQVSHPPGAPFYMLVGRLFAMVVPGPHVSLAVNMVSVLASAITVLFTYWIIVRLVREWQGSAKDPTPSQRICAVAGGVIGACAFAVSDSFWFNAVEAEVYGMSMLFTAGVVLLIMRWSDHARREESALRGGQHPFGLRANRYLVLVAYLFGLAIGVHLLSLLALFFIALIFFFVEYDRPEWTQKGRPDWRSPQRWAGIWGALVIASGAFLVIYPGIIQKLPAWAGKTGSPLLVLLGVVAVVTFAVYFSHKRGMQIANLASLCLLMVLIGYSTYALIFIRSASNPPIDENDPETAEAIVSYLAREQYGETPLLTGPAFNDRTGEVDGRITKNFPRRYSPMPQHWRRYAQYDSDLDFFLKYQVRHMYVRYFLWNFMGRESDVEGSRAITGLPFLDGSYEHYFQTPSERASRNGYFALPLLLGLLGMLYHFTQDWRRAFSVLILFLLTGLGIIVYLNQTPMQPRERDYSYVASFFAFSLWIGIGATGLLQLLSEAMERARPRMRQAMLGGCCALLFVAAPGWMMLENYDDHDRSGRYAAPEYAYNMLMSMEEDAIVFTNGDNDTFPLWYAQEVEGVRRDVRVVNLSLLNTPWYVRQLKNQASRESPPLPISLGESLIGDLSMVAWNPQTVALPVDKEALRASSEVFTGQSNVDQFESPMTWTLQGRPYGAHPSTGDPVHVLHGADVAALDILRTNANQGWKRPVYFAVTVSPDGRLDLDNYLQLEGQAYRVVPLRHEERMGRVEPTLTPERLRQFKFTNLSDPDVYYDSNIRRMVDNYRNVFAQSATGLIEAGRSDEAVALLDTIMEQVPFETIPGDLGSFVFMARAYQIAGLQDRVISILGGAEGLVIHQLATAQSAAQQRYVADFVQSIRSSYVFARDYEAAAAFETKLYASQGDSTTITAEELRQRFEGAPEIDSADASPDR